MQRPSFVLATMVSIRGRSLSMLSVNTYLGYRTLNILTITENYFTLSLT